MPLWPGRRAPKMALGLDIGRSAIKVVELARSPQGLLTLTQCARAAVPLGSVVDGHIERLEPLAGVLRELVQRTGVRSRRVAMALPTKHVILRKIRLRGGMSEDERALHVESVAAGFVPFPVKDLALDYSVMGPVHGSASEVEVLIAAARRDRVEDRLAVAEAAGLTPIILETESNASQLALQAWHRRRGNPQATDVLSLVDLGFESTTMRVVAGQDILFEREQSWGARRLVDRLMRECGLNEEQAGSGLLSGDLLRATCAHIVAEHVDATVRELDRLLQFFYAGAPGRRLTSMVLAGGAAGVDGLASRVADAIGVPTLVMNPFEHMELGPGVEASSLSGQSGAFLQACGLALRSFES